MGEEIVLMLLDNKFIKFIIVGIINTLVGNVLIFILYNICEIGYWSSSAIGYILVSILSFFLNKYFTFGVKQWSVFMIAAFILTICFSYLIAYGISKPIMNLLLNDSPKNIRENIALFTGMCLFTGINYLGQRLIVFRIKEKKEYK